MRTPEFWRERASLPSILLTPAAVALRAAALARAAVVRAERAPVPVVCVGNLVAGGAGKTPAALAVGERLRREGIAAHFLTRGYGGRLGGPVRVDPGAHTAREVGDEALLLAAVAPTWVARHRAAGARAAAAAGAAAIVMDDGFQNPTLEKDVSLLVVDAGYGFGNGRLLPAGPLREPVAAGLARAQAVVLLDGAAEGQKALFEGLPVLAARLVPEETAMRLARRRVFAFAGIGRPGKFFDTLAEMGCEVVGRRSFPDHHRYAAEEIMEICEAAAAAGAVPVTTAKDAARLGPEARPLVEVVAVRLVWQDEAALARVLAPVVERARGPA